MFAAFFIENLFQPGGQLFFVCVVLTVVISIVLHELAHGWTAIWQGDDTPRISGHMTADPLTHMGGMSLFALILVGIAWGAMPVNPNRFRHRYGDAIVSVAGPAMNILLALIGLTILAFWWRIDGSAQAGAAYNLQKFLEIFGIWNIVLAMFNMAPVPPLDGSRIIGNFVPAYQRMLGRMQNPEILFFMFFMVLMMAPAKYNLFVIGRRIAEAYLKLFV